MIAKEDSANFDIFKDCLSTTIIQRLAPDGGGKGSTRKKVKGRKNEIKPVARIASEDERNDAVELGDFVEVSQDLCIQCYLIMANNRTVPRGGDLSQSSTGVEILIL